MRVTSVLGHIKTYDFPTSCKNWSTTPLTDLYSMPLVKQTGENSKDVVKNIQDAARGIQQLVLWLDCDREGEAIAYEVIEVCRSVSPDIKLFRAHFSTVTAADIESACQHLTPPNPNLADAVNVRQEVDLRIGASFTRYQTLMMQEKFPKRYKVVSYGPCQFPTLGFIVERYKLIRDFVPEKFFYLDCRCEREIMDMQKGCKTKCEVKFDWRRERLFDELSTLVVYESCLEAGSAKVTKIDKTVAHRRRPYPLNTVEMEKSGSRRLFMAGHRIMEVAEKLYNKGLISYPRTETSRYGTTINTKEVAKKLAGSAAWGGFVHRLTEDSSELFNGPLYGKGDDKAHPPIHPVKLASQNDLEKDEWKVYEFVVRHFLASISRDASGNETRVEVRIGTETFTTRGLKIDDYGWLEVYPYERWSDKELPEFKLGEVFVPASLMMEDSMTGPPKRLTEADLISKMDANGIGTDATIHEHIKTVQDRYCLTA